MKVLNVKKRLKIDDRMNYFGEIMAVVIICALCIFSINESHLKQESINQLQEKEGQIDILESTLDNRENQINDLESQVDILENRLDDREGQINNLESQVDTLESELKKLQNGSIYEMHDPTYIELISFIEKDTTDTIPYDEEKFNCGYYVQRVNDNAEKQGIRCAYVVLNFEKRAHAIVGFNTVDKGMKYIEPQSDEWVKNLEPGNDYWTDCVIPEPGCYYENNPDDTIQSVLIYW